jgi:hypothetical protein
MKKNFVKAFILIFSINITFATEDSYTPEQLLDLMEASMQNYETMTAEVETSSYRISREGLPDELEMNLTRTWRWTKTRSYCKTDQRNIASKDRPSSQPEQKIKSVVLAPEWEKSLVEIPGSSTPRGKIRQRGAMQVTFNTPMATMWDIFCEMPWQKSHINLADASVEKENNSGLLIFKYRIGFDPKATQVVLYVDSSKDFIPVVKEYRLYNEELVFRYENVLQKSDSGLWVPKEYSIAIRDERFKKYIVKNLKVNVPIPDQLLDFAFPSGTVVIDEIADLRYHVDDDVLDIAMAEQDKGALDERRSKSTTQKTSNGLDFEGVEVRRLASQKELEKTIDQAQTVGYKKDKPLRLSLVYVSIFVLVAAVVLYVAIRLLKK